MMSWCCVANVSFITSWTTGLLWIERSCIPPRWWIIQFELLTFWTRTWGSTPTLNGKLNLHIWWQCSFVNLILTKAHLQCFDNVTLQKWQRRCMDTNSAWYVKMVSEMGQSTLWYFIYGITIQFTYSWIQWWLQEGISLYNFPCHICIITFH